MNAKWSIIAALLLAFGCGKDPGNTEPDPEVCGNQTDDDKDGLVDCSDPDCSEEASCQPAPECAAQEECFPTAYDYFDYVSEPIPRCDGAKKCVTEGQSIDLLIQLKKGTGWSGIGWPTPGATIRLIKKTAVDGSPVTCDTISAIATGDEEQDADQLERAQKFNYLAFEAQSVNNSEGAVPLLIFSNVTTGSDFLVYAELWSGKLATATHYPTGKRLEWRCYDTANTPQTTALLADIIPEDDWPDGMSTSTSRTMNIEMQGPR